MPMLLPLVSRQLRRWHRPSVRLLAQLAVLLLLCCCGPRAVLADVRFTKPAAGASIAGGTVLQVEWEDSGDAPSISDLTTYQLFLCAGGNENPVYI